MVFVLVLLTIFYLSSSQLCADTLASKRYSSKDIEYFNSMIDLTSKGENLTNQQRQFYAKNGLKHAISLKSDSLIAIAQQNMGFSYYLLDQIDSALYYYHLALGNFRTVDDSTGMSLCYTNIGGINIEQYNYEDAVLSLDAALDIERATKDTLGMISTKFNLLKIYIHRHIFEKAWFLLNDLEIFVDNYYINEDYLVDFAILKADYFLQFLSSNSKFNVQHTDYLLHNNSPGFTNTITKSNIQDAEEAVISMSALIDQRHDSVYMATKYLFKGNLESMKNNIFLAQKYYYNALHYSIKYSQINKLETYCALGLIFAMDANHEKSIEYFKNVDSLATEMDNINFIRKANTALQLLYQHAMEYRKSIWAFKKLMKYQDTTNHVIALNALYRHIVEESVDKKEQLIAELQYEKTLLSVRITYWIVIFILAMILLVVFILLFRKKRSLVKELTDRNVELAVMTEQYLQANSVKDTMFSIVAHDLKNPVSSFVSMADLIVTYYNDISDEEKLQYLKDIKITANQLFNLLQNLLTWSRTQRDQIECNQDYLDLSMIVENTIDGLTPQAKSKQIDLVTKIDYSIVYVDCNLTMTIIRNLVSNAIKFTESNKSIFIGTQDIDNAFMEIYVKDEGVGIPKDKLDKMFTYSSNSSSMGTAGEAGTGLGLMLCKEFALLQNGDIRVESKLGLGSTFYVKVPKNGKEQVS